MIEGNPHETPEREPTQNCCSCKGSCCQLGCPCFQHGGVCGPNCQCHNCQNVSIWGEERLNAIEAILETNPTAFTATKDLNQEEHTLISNFSMLATSIDSEPFQTKSRNSALSKLLVPDVTNQAIKTVISAATKNLITEGKKNEESTENCVSLEFENVLKTILNAIETQ